MSILHKMVCDDRQNFEGLLSSLAVIKNLLNCDKDGKILTNTAYDIIQKLFNIGNKCGEPLEWFDTEVIDGCFTYYSCFEEKKIYFNSKCKIKCCYWKPHLTPCVIKCLEIAKKKILDIYEQFGNDQLYNLVHCSKTFKTIIDILSLYLSYDLKKEKYDDVLSILNVMCDIIKQRILIQNVIKKELIKC